jgi:N-acetyl-1-D-myo-inositol-2-amino-2-deoxy-alpha-D-glucopyranoside deacetylase
MPEGGLLAIFAHPDDETFGIGGTMAHYAGRGVPVTMICATRGEVGEIAPGTDATPENLGVFREQELRDACAILGVQDVRFLGFRDSGMAGTADNEDQRAFARAHPDAVTHLLVKLIRETRPRVIVTWDPSGGYGHPDHIAAHKHATRAYSAAADPAQFPTAGPPHKADALYWLALPMSIFAELDKELRARGLPTFDVPGGAEELQQLEHVEPNVVLDVRDHYDQKVQALASHRTQMNNDDIFVSMPDDLRRKFFANEYFYRVDPKLPDGTMLHGLFEGEG